MKFRPICEERTCEGLEISGAVPQDGEPMTTGSVPGAVKGRRKGAKPRCEDCFFRQNMLCALRLEAACPTFRPAHPDGLRPPRQLSFAFRQEHRQEELSLSSS
jgi:hypothetical protein